MKSESKKVKLTKETKVKLLLAIKQGYIDVSDFPELKLNPTLNITVIDNGIPLASSEDEIFEFSKVE